MTDQDRRELPLPDYDHIPQGMLSARIAPLDEAGVEALLAYEKGHGDRLPVVVVLEQRLEQLRGGAEPTGTLVADGPEKTGAPGTTSIDPSTARDSVPPPAKSGPMLPHQPA